MKKCLFLAFPLLLIARFAHPQGCIAIRNIAGFGQYNLTDNAFSTSNWVIDINNRYYKSFRNFVGTREIKMSKNDEPVIYSITTNFMVTRLLDKGWSLSLSLPVSSNARTSAEEHGGPGTPRHTTRSFGMGDIRVMVYKWLLPPAVRQKINVQIGLGIKLPTGDYKYQDYFYRNDSSFVLAPVEVPIQLGDGGTGIITEVNAFYILSEMISFFGNFSYLSNPRDQNGVPNTFGKTPTSLQIKSGYYIASVPDQYLARAGITFHYNKLILSAGARDEGVPVYDLIGGSNGARKAGHNISLEPGIGYKLKKVTVYAYLPVIVARKIKQNVPDKILTQLTGNYTLRHGGSPDYLVFAGVSFKL
jgi:hypothetical protein